MKAKSIVYFAAFCGVSFLNNILYAQSARRADFIEVPFEFYRNSVILQVKVNGKGPYSMLLDTGTDPSAIDLGTAKQIGLKITPVDVGGVGAGSGRIVSYQSVLPEIQIGDFVAKNVEALAGESLSKVSQRLGRALHGVLGYSLLKDRIVQFDYPKRMIRFYSVCPFSEPGEQTERRIILPFELFNATPLIDEVYVNGKRIKATLDTGSNGTLRLTAIAIKFLDLEDEAQKAEPVSVAGYGGKAKYRKGQLKTLALSKLEVNARQLRLLWKREKRKIVRQGVISEMFF
jgi:hypothetical protein